MHCCWCCWLLLLLQAESLVNHLAADMASEGIKAKTLTLKLKTTAFEVRARAGLLGAAVAARCAADMHPVAARCSATTACCLFGLLLTPLPACAHRGHRHAGAHPCCHAAWLRVLCRGDAAAHPAPAAC